MTDDDGYSNTDLFLMNGWENLGISRILKSQKKGLEKAHCCPQLKIIHSQLTEKDMTQKDFHWKTMMKIMKMVILQKGQSMIKRIQGLFILVIGWLALSAMEPFVCSILHNFLPASNNWINGQHGFIKNETGGTLPPGASPKYILS